MRRINGAYYDPASVGCGFFVTDEGNGKVMAAFFGHDRLGNQIHLTGFGNPEDGFDLTMTRGMGYPTFRAEHIEHAGTLQFAEGETELFAHLAVRHDLLGEVDVSPRPPAGHKVLLTFRLTRIELG